MIKEPFRRTVYLHVGPTNSGKTHHAMERLKRAKSGIYLAPLRLLAYEIYSQLNKDNVPCTMETGEEKKEILGATHYSKTIELFNPEEIYDVAVIDEAQMIADPKRGGAWTNAILEINASEMHICMAPEAFDIISKILSECEDDVHVIEHERMTKLEIEETPFHFPQDVQKGDALIVFSKRNVIAVAAELQEKKIPCSIIYGSLPYDVREQEVSRFLHGETNVVVSTDAIGMGMNLPVRRVVFLEMEKFDGSGKRFLYPSELKQIAGRAGRYGMYDTGYCTTEYHRKFLQKQFTSKVQPIEKAVLSFPQSMIHKNGKLSHIVTEWKKMNVSDMYQKEDVSDFLYLIRIMERITNDKELIYEYATIPFDLKNEILLHIWQILIREVAAGEEMKWYIHNVYPERLNELEQIYKEYDLYYNFARKLNDVDAMNLYQKEKEIVSIKMTQILKTKKLEGKKCSICRKKLKWNYPYGICQKCYKRQYGFWDDFW